MQTERLVQRLRARRADERGAAFDLWDFLHDEGSALDALMYAKLLWPDFVEVEDMVFLEGHTVDPHAEGPKRVRDVLKRRQGDRTATERAFNHVEVGYLFGTRRGQATAQEDHFLGEVLRETWEARLRSLYPDRRFVVKLVDESNEGGEVYVVFYQRRRSGIRATL